MTSIGHSLTGLSIGVLAMPRLSSWVARGTFLAGFALLANMPDVPLPHWGHDRYDISHSIFVSLALIAAFAFVLSRWPALWHALGGGWAILGGGAAWLSHLLLDSFYNHRLGVRIFWPLSDAALGLPLPWFRRVRTLWPMDAYSLKVVAIEALFYGALLVLCVIARRMLIGPRRAGQ